MATTPIFKDRVLATTTSTSAPFTMSSAIAGFQAFSVVGNGISCQYYIEAVDSDGVPTGDWSVNIGTYNTTGPVLSEDKVLASSNSGSSVSWSAGTKRVGLIGPAVSASGSLPRISDFGGRLTLVTGVPIPTTDQTGKSHLFYTPYIHNQTPKWNGSSWEIVTFTEYDLTLTLTSDKNYDVFWNGSALSLSAAWSDDNTRTDAISTQDNVVCLSSDHTKLWVGIIRASGSNTTEDSYGKRFVMNFYNTVLRGNGAQGASSHTYASTERNWNNDTSTLIQWLEPIAGTALILNGSHRCAGTTINGGCKIQINSGSEAYSQLAQIAIAAIDAITMPMVAAAYGLLGYNTAIVRELSFSGTLTFSDATVHHKVML